MAGTKSNGMRVVVIGASAGGVEALSQLASQLPRDFPAPILVVLHVPHSAVSVLPDILRRAGELPAVHAASREPLRPGRIYVAPPDRHMMIRDGHVTSGFGPRENGHRPAIDPLFRSAAISHGADVIGVVLTGNLDDGTAGLLAIKQAGGMAIVQDPEDAMYAGMPSSAIHSVEVDCIVPLSEIVPTLIRMIDNSPSHREAGMENGNLEYEVKSTAMDDTPVGESPDGNPSGFTCPECSGGLWEVEEGRLVRFRCRVGHAYSADSLASAYGSSVEAALWAALRSLEENAAFSKRLAERAKLMRQPNARKRFHDQEKIAAQHAKTLRDILATGDVFSETSVEVTAPE